MEHSTFGDTTCALPFPLFLFRSINGVSWSCALINGVCWCFLVVYSHERCFPSPALLQTQTSSNHHPLQSRCRLHNIKKHAQCLLVLRSKTRKHRCTLSATACGKLSRCNTKREIVPVSHQAHGELKKIQESRSVKYIHTHTQTHTQTRTNTRTNTYTHTHIHTYTHAYIHPHKHITSSLLAWRRSS